MRKKIFHIMFFLYIPFLLVAQKQEWTLEDCIQYALKNNISIKMQRNDVEQSRMNYKYSKLNFLPEINSAISQDFNFGRNASPESNQYTDLNTKTTGFSLSMSLPLSTQIQSYRSLKINKLDMQASLSDLEQAKVNVTLNVITAYLQILYQYELASIWRNQVKLSYELYQKNAAMNELEVTSNADVLNAKAQYAEDQFALTQSENEYQQALLSLAHLLNISEVNNFKIGFSDTLPTAKAKVFCLDEIYQSSVSCSPRIIAEQYRLKKSQKDIALAKSNLLPTLSLQIGINTGYYNIEGVTTYNFQQQWRNNMNKNITFTLSIPLFNHLSVFKNIKTAKFQMDNQRLSLENYKLELFKEIQNYYLKVVNSEKKMEAGKFTLESLEELYKQTNQKYLLGKITTYEYNETKTKYLKAKIEYTQTLYENRFNMKILEYYQSFQTSELHDKP